MISKKGISIILFLMAFTIGTWSENRKITEVGRYPFARLSGNVSAQEMGVKLSQRYDKGIIEGFALSGYPELANPFLVELNSGRYGEKELAPGTVFTWMLFRANGKIKVVNDLEWAGSAPLPAYTFTVRHADKDYEFVVPKPCGNVALIGIKDVVIQPDETIVKTAPPAPIPESTPPEPQIEQAPVVSESPRHLFFLVEGGPGVVRGSFTTIFWIRAGLLFQLVPEELDLILSFGGGSSFRAEPQKAFLMANALLSYHLQPFYLAGGLGYSTRERTNRKDGFDLVAEVGCDLFQQEYTTGSLFFEFRAPVFTSERLFDQHYKALLGLRLIF